jgi:5-hydroxyisourate hydrolase
MSGRLTTHVLDVGAGRPAAGVSIEVWALEGEGGRRRIAMAVTNQQGRTDEALIEGDLTAGTYELTFDVGRYFGSGRSGFLDVVPVRFTVSDPAAHYHVPLLVTPWSYSTYRGS